MLAAMAHAHGAEGETHLGDARLNRRHRERDDGAHRDQLDGVREQHAGEEGTSHLWKLDTLSWQKGDEMPADKRQAIGKLNDPGGNLQEPWW